MCNLLKNLSNESIKMKRSKSASDLKGAEEEKNQSEDASYTKFGMQTTSTGSLNQKTGQYLLERIEAYKKNP